MFNQCGVGIRYFLYDRQIDMNILCAYIIRHLSSSRIGEYANAPSSSVNQSIPYPLTFLYDGRMDFLHIVYRDQVGTMGS